MITEIEEEEPTGFIRFEKFERMMSRILLENQYPRAGRDGGRPRQRQRPTALPATAAAPGAHRILGPVHRTPDYTYCSLLTAYCLLTILTGTRATRRRSCCVRSGRSTLTTRLGLGLGPGFRVSV